jgi:hypothetical protein
VDGINPVSELLKQPIVEKLKERGNKKFTISKKDHIGGGMIMKL